ncbi:MAG: response regulator [Bacilli bacterium]|nr:response regulator [Bacilli bacterium]
MVSSYFASVGLTITALLFLLLMGFMYLYRGVSKKRNESRTIFVGFYVITLILLVLELICSYTISIRDTHYLLNEILCKVYVFFGFLWDALIVSYVYFAINADNPKYVNKKSNIINLIYLGFMIILSIVLCLALPLEYTGGNGDPYIMIGTLTNVFYTFSTVFASLAILMFVIFRKNNKNINVVLLVMVLVFYLLAFLIQEIYHYQISDSIFFYTLTLLVLYFTIESRDRELIKEFETAKVEAEKSNKVKTEFLMNASHQIRTPLNTILGFSDMLLMEEEMSDEEIKGEIENIYVASTNLLVLINNILDISKIESKNELLVEDKYKLETLAFEINSLILSRSNDKNLKYTLNIDENLPTEYIGDLPKLQKIIVSLLLNAIEHTSLGEVSLTVSGNMVNREECELAFLVHNSGHAMKYEDFNLSFEEFIELNDERSASINSSSLGIIIAKKLIEIIGGNIEFINQEGMGTRYIVKLRQKVSDTTPIGNIYDKIRNLKSEQLIDCFGKRVLVVDDDPINQKIAQTLLGRYRFEIDAANSGEECIKRVNEEKYDLIFLDHMMSGIDGLETVRQLKTSEFKLPPIIALTANNQEGMKNEYLAAGFDDYLAKPIDFKKLNEIINRLFKDIK